MVRMPCCFGERCCLPYHCPHRCEAAATIINGHDHDLSKYRSLIPSNPGAAPVDFACRYGRLQSVLTVDVQTIKNSKCSSSPCAAAPSWLVPMDECTPNIPDAPVRQLLWHTLDPLGVLNSSFR